MRTRASFAAGWTLTCLAVLLAIVLSAGVGQADKGEDWGAVELANVGDEPQALGEATLTNVRYVGWYYDGWLWYYVYSGDLTVTCHNLQPRATYWTRVGTFQTDRRGTGKAGGKASAVYFYDWDWSPNPEIDVVRFNADGSRTTVLTSDGFLPPWY